jgi:hypothetical protein
MRTGKYSSCGHFTYSTNQILLAAIIPKLRHIMSAHFYFKAWKSKVLHNVGVNTKLWRFLVTTVALEKQ